MRCKSAAMLTTRSRPSTHALTALTGSSPPRPPTRRAPSELTLPLPTCSSPTGPSPTTTTASPSTIARRPLADADTLAPSSPVAVPFKNRTHGERFYLGHLVKIANTPRMPTTALVRFTEVEPPPSKYLVDHDRLFIPDFHSRTRESP